MKLPLTDKFLCDVYNIVNKTGNILNFPIFEKYRKQRGKERFRQFIYYLKRKKYIKIKKIESKQAIILTKEGIGKALRASFITEGKKKREDGKWVMLIFDVPEKQRGSRDLLRSILNNLGYKMLQQSVWISPYDIFEKTEKLLQIYSLDDYVKIFLVVV